MEIIKEFGIQPILLAAQVVNFIILLLILRKFLYKPILKVLEARKQKIAESLKNAEEIEKRLQEITEKEIEALQKSARQAEQIIKEASVQGAGIIDDSKKKAEQLLEQASEDAKDLVKQEKEKLMREVKENLSDIVVLALQKITGKTITPSDQKRLIEQELKNLS